MAPVVLLEIFVFVYRSQKLPHSPGMTVQRRRKGGQLDLFAGQKRISRIAILEVAAGLEPAKTGFADQRLDRFGIATSERPELQPAFSRLARSRQDA